MYILLTFLRENKMPTHLCFCTNKISTSILKINLPLLSNVRLLYLYLTEQRYFHVHSSYFDKLRIYMQRSTVLLMATGIPLMAVYLFSKPILLLGHALQRILRCKSSCRRRASWIWACTYRRRHWGHTSRWCGWCCTFFSERWELLGPT